MMEEFTTAEIQTAETSIFVRSYGCGPALLLLHGFPQTHLMWRSVAPLLARNFKPQDDTIAASGTGRHMHALYL